MRLAIALALTASVAACQAPARPATSDADEDARRADRPASLQALVDTELSKITGRAGVWVKHLTTGEEAAYHADDTFNAASVIKIPVAVLAMRMADAGQLRLDERLTITKADMRDGSGVFRHHDPGLQPTFRDVVMQMIATSDNTATDIAIRKVGGVERVNAFIAEAGHAPGMRLAQTTGELDAKYAGVGRGAERIAKTNTDAAGGGPAPAALRRAAHRPQDRRHRAGGGQRRRDC